MKESLSNPLKCVKARSEDLNIIFAVEPTTGLSDLFFYVYGGLTIIPVGFYFGLL